MGFPLILLSTHSTITLIKLSTISSISSKAVLIILKLHVRIKNQQPFHLDNNVLCHTQSGHYAGVDYYITDALHLMSFDDTANVKARNRLGDKLKIHYRRAFKLNLSLAM